MYPFCSNKENNKQFICVVKISRREKSELDHPKGDCKEWYLTNEKQKSGFQYSSESFIFFTFLKIYPPFKGFSKLIMVHIDLFM